MKFMYVENTNHSCHEEKERDEKENRFGIHFQYETTREKSN